jgi:cysteinyl-tRNA synthetase
LLGSQYDLHGGALDLVFPHHEAEIAQMEAVSGKAPLARYWMHTGLLRVGRDKMSKSLGNFLTIRQALELADFRTLRYAFLTQHYRTSMELNEETFTNARNGRKRVENFARTIERHHPSSVTERDRIDEARAEFTEGMNDDFDTPGAISALFTCIRDLHKVGERPGASAWDFLAEIDDLFDMFDLGATDTPLADGIEDLIERRRALRHQKRFEEADAVRSDLLRQGIVLEDTSSGTRWWHADRSARQGE